MATASPTLAAALAAVDRALTTLFAERQFHPAYALARAQYDVRHRAFAPSALDELARIAAWIADDADASLSATHRRDLVEASDLLRALGVRRSSGVHEIPVAEPATARRA